ncbi:hypothetical protein [uncultured Desulfobacter sp.]|nr:hypothetical protein [uncultured Desulfobacter sp.]
MKIPASCGVSSGFVVAGPGADRPGRPMAGVRLNIFALVQGL